MQVDFNNLRITLGRAYNETVLAAQAAQHDGRLERIEKPLKDLRDMVVTLCALIPPGEKESVLADVGEFLVFDTTDTEDLDDIDVSEAIKEIEGVSMVLENYQILEEEYTDADYYIFTVDGFGEEQKAQLTDLLLRYSMSAYIEVDDTVSRIPDNVTRIPAKHEPVAAQ